jgi:hypothetical protein
MSRPTLEQLDAISMVNKTVRQFINGVQECGACTTSILPVSIVLIDGYVTTRCSNCLKEEPYLIKLNTKEIFYLKCQNLI